MENTLKGKRILVTGAGQGIGRGIATQLAVCGAKVVAVGRTKSFLETLKAEVSNIEIISVDLGDWNATRQALKNVGRLDALVNNAGTSQLVPFFDSTPEVFDRLFNLNVKAVLNVSQIVAKDWVANKTGGSIVNISSKAALAGFEDRTIYCATKGALDALSRAMAVELGPHQIRVNCVNPTVILTEMSKVGWSDKTKAEWMKSRIPLGRFGEVQEVVDAVLFLLSEKASLINGVSLPLDGGFMAQ